MQEVPQNVLDLVDADHARWVKGGRRLRRNAVVIDMDDGPTFITYVEPETVPRGHKATYRQAGK